MIIKNFPKYFLKSNISTVTLQAQVIDQSKKAQLYNRQIKITESVKSPETKLIEFLQKSSKTLNKVNC